MQTTPAPGFVPNERLGSTRSLLAMRVLMMASCCTALVAFAFMYVSFTLADEVLAANPSGATPTGPLLQTIETLHTVWLICGVAGLLSWSCAFVVRHSASASTRGARRAATILLVVGSLSLVGLACSFGWYEVALYGTRIG